MLARIPERSRRLNYLVVDLETSGLDPARHEIVEIGAVLLDEICLEMIGEYEAKVAPSPMFTLNAQAEALVVNGYDDEVWKAEGISLRSALTGLSAFGDLATFAAWNVAFDWSFLAHALSTERVSLGLGDYHKLCVYSMARQELRGEVDHLTLSEVVEYYGGEPEDRPHRALNGARSAALVLRHLVTEAP